jgi:hypothetical protein
MPAGVVLHRGAGRVRLDRLNALLGIGLRLVTLAGGDDLAIRGLQVESELRAEGLPPTIPRSSRRDLVRGELSLGI